MTYTRQDLELKLARRLYENNVLDKIRMGRECTLTTSLQTIHDELVRLAVRDKLSCEVNYVDGKWSFKFEPDVHAPQPVKPPVNVDGEPVVQNEHGGLQSELDVDMTLLPYDALERVARVLTENSDEYGGSYPRDNWRKVGRRDHLNHAIHHLLKAANQQEIDFEELSHAGCRVLLALANLKEDKPREPES